MPSSVYQIRQARRVAAMLPEHHRTRYFPELAADLTCSLTELYAKECCIHQGGVLGMAVNANRSVEAAAPPVAVAQPIPVSQI